MDQQQDLAAAKTSEPTEERKDETPVLEPKAPSSSDGKNLIGLAVAFLNNPRVQGSPMEQKRAFLKKKGLTDVEIDRAIQLAGTSPAAMATVPQTNQIAPPPLPPRPLTPPPRSRSWQEYAVIAVVLGGVGYAVIRFIRDYVIPWFERPKVQEQKLDDLQSSVQQLENSVSTTVASLNETTTAIRDLLSEQQQQLKTLTSQVSAMEHGSVTNPALNDIKDEIGSLKGLLLNRHQFPTPTRQGSTGIPVWQRTSTHPPPSTPPPSTPSQTAPQENRLDDSESGTNAKPETRKTETENGLQEWHDATDAVN